MLFTPFTFQNGKTAKTVSSNPPWKSNLPKTTSRLKTCPPVRLWAEGGAGVLATGNVMVAESGKGSINDVLISDDRALEMLKNGRKPACKTTRCSSCKSIMRANSRLRWSIKHRLHRAVPLVGMNGFINPPRELSADEINGLIQQFVQTAKIAEQAGFSGVQIYAVHGYLISQFLSPHHNRRQDQWGGSLENRMRFLWKPTPLFALRGQRFLGGRKTQFGRFPKGGFDESESVQVVQNCRKWALILLKFPVATTKARKCSPPKTAPANAKPSSSITPKSPCSQPSPADYHRRIPFANRHGRCLIQRSFGFGRHSPPVCLSP